LHLVGILFPHINDDARSKSLQTMLYLNNCGIQQILELLLWKLGLLGLGSPFIFTSAKVKRFVFVWSLWSLFPPPSVKGTSIVAQRDILNSHYCIQPYTGNSIVIYIYIYIYIYIITIKMNVLCWDGSSEFETLPVDFQINSNLPAANKYFSIKFLWFRDCLPHKTVEFIFHVTDI